MLLVRTLILLLLIAAGVSFALFAFTGQARHKQRGLAILKWTLAAAFVFFAVLIWDRVA
jgi:hypothetical protein